MILAVLVLTTSPAVVFGMVKVKVLRALFAPGSAASARPQDPPLTPREPVFATSGLVASRTAAISRNLAATTPVAGSGDTVSERTHSADTVEHGAWGAARPSDVVNLKRYNYLSSAWDDKATATSRHLAPYKTPGTASLNQWVLTRHSAYPTKGREPAPRDGTVVKNDDIVRNDDVVNQGGNGGEDDGSKCDEPVGGECVEDAHSVAAIGVHRSPSPSRIEALSPSGISWLAAEDLQPIKATPCDSESQPAPTLDSGLRQDFFRCGKMPSLLERVQHDEAVRRGATPHKGSISARNGPKLCSGTVLAAPAPSTPRRTAPATPRRLFASGDSPPAARQCAARGITASAAHPRPAVHSHTACPSLPSLDDLEDKPAVPVLAQLPRLVQAQPPQMDTQPAPEAWMSSRSAGTGKHKVIGRDRLQSTLRPLWKTPLSAASVVKRFGCPKDGGSLRLRLGGSSRAPVTKEGRADTKTFAAATPGVQ